MIDQWRQLTVADDRFIYYKTIYSLLHRHRKGKAVVIFNTNNRYGAHTAITLKCLGFKVFKRWTGTDILNLAKLSHLKQGLALWVFKRLVDRHYTSISWLCDKLEHLSIYNSIIWLLSTPLFSSKNQLTETNIKHKFTRTPIEVLTYSNSGREWVYNTERMIEVAKQFPEYKFWFIGNNDFKPPLNSIIESLGEVPEEKMRHLLESCSFFIRITEHDGFSRMVTEALLYGLNVISNFPREHTINAYSIDEICQAIKQPPKRNTEGR